MTGTKEAQYKQTLADYKKSIEGVIEEFCAQALNETHEQFGEYPLEAVKAYCAILGRGGKRIRGVLTMVAYEMLGGTNKDVALKAALAVEMLHAYILMTDDIQDRSIVRRGGPTAHVMLTDYHSSRSLKNDSEHFGASIAMNGFLFGLHSAINVLSELDVLPKIRLEAIRKVNEHFIVTIHGQSADIFNEVVETVDEKDVDRVMTWKTAYYSFFNPLQLGALLAGAKSEDFEQLKNYSLAAGRAFQITDDILGVFGDQKKLGKSPMDDIREGKRTLLTVKALEFAPKADAYFLDQMLGNKLLTGSQFKQCKEIIATSGALDYARRQAKNSVVDALASLDSVKKSWNKSSVHFLEQLVRSLPGRQT